MHDVTSEEVPASVSRTKWKVNLVRFLLEAKDWKRISGLVNFTVQYRVNSVNTFVFVDIVSAKAYRAFSLFARIWISRVPAEAKIGLSFEKSNSVESLESTLNVTFEKRASG